MNEDDEASLAQAYPGAGGCYLSRFDGPGYSESLVSDVIRCLKSCTDYNDQVGGGPALCEFQQVTSDTKS